MKLFKSKTFWIATVVILVLIGIGTATSNSKPATEQTIGNQAVESTPTAVKYNYQVLSRQENKTVENIAVLISSVDTNAEAIAMEVKDTCKKPCNIDIWNNRDSYNTNQQYSQMLGTSAQPDEITEFKEKHYVSWGDSLVGSIDFETGTYNDYPLQDWHYKELKGEK